MSDEYTIFGVPASKLIGRKVRALEQLKKHTRARDYDTGTIHIVRSYEAPDRGDRALLLLDCGGAWFASRFELVEEDWLEEFKVS